MKHLDPNIFPNNYLLAATDQKRQQWWPALQDGDFEFKSQKNPFYNCLAWAIHNNTDFVEMFYFQNKHNLDIQRLDHTVNGYATVLEKFYNFEKCDNGQYENGFEKIVLYGDNNGEWTHAARQLTNDVWVSKLGKWEDIEHTTVECLNGTDYGIPIQYMKRKVNEK